MIWILWDVDLLGTVKSFELAAILDWCDVNLGNTVFQFYLKANWPHKTYVVRSQKNSNWIWANHVRQTLLKKLTKAATEENSFWLKKHWKKKKKILAKPVRLCPSRSQSNSAFILIVITYRDVYWQLNLPLACAIATNVIKTANNRDIDQSLFKKIANTSVQRRTKQKKNWGMQLKYYCLKVEGNEDIFRISWVVLGVNFSSRCKHNKY